MKTKLWVCISSLALVFVIAGASLGAVISALQARATSGFSISYTARNVDAKVSGWYSQGGASDVSLGEDLVFSSKTNPSKQEDSFDVSPTVDLDGPNDFLEFHYTIQNTGTVGFGVSLALSGLEASNFGVRYSCSYRSNSQVASFKCIRTEMKNNLYVTPSGSDHEILDIGVKIAIKDITADSKAVGNFNFLLDGIMEEPKYSTLLSGGNFNSLINDCQTITFGNFTAENEFKVDGENKIASYLSVNDASEDGHTKVFTVQNNTGKDAYVLADQNYIMSLNEDASIMFLLSQAQTINGLNLIDTSNTTNMIAMFACSSVTELDVSNFDTSKVTGNGMLAMFVKCQNLKAIKGIENWDTSKVTELIGTTLFAGYSSLFYGCSKLQSLNLSGWDLSGIHSIGDHYVTDRSDTYAGLFEGLESLTTLDLSGWNTENVTSMDHLFYDSISLYRVYVGDGWKTDNVDGDYEMFKGCYMLEGEKGSRPSDYSGIECAHVDGGPSNPGYFTYKRFV